MISQQTSCRIQKRLNVINVNYEYCVRCVNFLFCLSFIQYKDVFFNNYDVRSSDVKIRQLWHQNLLSSIVMVFIWFMRFSNESGPVTEFWLQLKLV